MANPPANAVRQPCVHNVITFPRRRSVRTWTVSQDGDADFSSITAAIKAAGDGDTIVIGAGMYLESLRVDKAVHLVGPVDPRFAEEAIEDDDIPYALIIGTGSEAIRWTANGGSLRNLAISRADTETSPMTTSALIRMLSGRLRAERCVISDGAHGGVCSRGGELELVRCHIRNVNVGMCILDTDATLERVHVEGAGILALHLESGATLDMTDNCLEGRTVLRGAVHAFDGNDIEALYVHDTIGTSGNRISGLVHVCDFRSREPFAVGV